VTDDGYVCPNGHPVDPVRVHRCKSCHAGVIYEPAAHGVALLAALDAECERLRVFERAFAKVPPEQQARIMAAVRADRAAGK
jgi:hypothetical protein